jgi:hypothetical protein
MATWSDIFMPALNSISAHYWGHMVDVGYIPILSNKVLSSRKKKNMGDAIQILEELPLSKHDILKMLHYV